MSSLISYDPTEVKVTVFGVGLEGFKKSSFVKKEKLENTNNVRLAMDSTGTAILNPYKNYRVTVTLDQSSEFNTLLFLLHDIYVRSGTNVRMPLGIEDKNGTSKFFSLDTFFETIPTQEWSEQTSPMEWSFLCYNSTDVIGGYRESSRLTNALQNAIRYLDTADALGIDLSAMEGKLSEGIENLSGKLRDFW